MVDGAGNYIGNKPRDDSQWLKWQTKDNQGNTIWQSAQRGWSLRVPRIEITNFTTGVVEADVFESLAVAIVNNPDLQQVPIDNCYGSLTFCWRRIHEPVITGFWSFQNVREELIGLIL